VRARRLRSGTWAVVQLRRNGWTRRSLRRVLFRFEHRHLELWRRTDVAGHSIACDGRPAIVDTAIRCECYASAWRRVGGWRR
jgi:hypothetical protein